MPIEAVSTPIGQHHASLDKFLSVLNVLRQVDPEFPLHYAICLAEIARDEGMSLTQLAERTNLALSTVSRIVGCLSKYRPNGRPYELISLQMAADERRRRELYLTPAGRELLGRITAQYL